MGQKSCKHPPDRLGTVRAISLVLLVTSALLGWSMPAQAHTSLISTDPTEGARLASVPEQVVLTFSENLREPSTVGVAVDGEEVEVDFQVDGPRVVVTPPSDAPEGTYDINYRVISADGHPVTGTLSFEVAQAAGIATEEAPAGDEPTATQSPETATNDAAADAEDDSVWSSPLLLGVGVLAVVLAIGAVTILRRRSVTSDHDRS